MAKKPKKAEIHSKLGTTLYLMKSRIDTFLNYCPKHAQKIYTMIYIELAGLVALMLQCSMSKAFALPQSHIFL